MPKRAAPISKVKCNCNARCVCYLIPHFYTATLREVGGWDPYNVTEDADLGMRLARFGYRSDMIDSTTLEEAPARIGAWLRQRTRWFKGWIQTWLVHMRQPRRLLRELGLPGFLTFQLIVGGNALAALVHPLFMGGLIYSAVSGAPMCAATAPSSRFSPRSTAPPSSSAI
jgi:cellulose synthase/poly-beta-1,6-N-acetylglucosamine synthase-like glycosyltransferase